MILTGFFSIGQQVVILFILMSVGFACSKAKLVQPESILTLNNIHLYVVMPCVIVNSFHRDYSFDMLASLGMAVLAAMAVHAINIAAATFLVRDKRQSREVVLRFGAVFSNCGNMAIPLQVALLGSEGVFYSAAFIAVTNVFMWTYGIFLMDKKEAGFPLKKIILNPGIIAIIIGFFFFLTPVTLPGIILSPMRALGALNTPLSMIVIGYYLSCLSSLKVIFNAKLWLVLLLRLIALPVIEIILFHALGLKGAVLVSVAISACAPVAANTLVFASKFNKDTELAVTLVSIATLASIATMPLVVSLSMVLP